MANHLGVSLGAYTELFQTLTRAMQKYNLRHAPLVPLVHINVMLQKGEVAYWLEPGQLYEEKVVRRRYEGGSAGVSFRVAKGVSFRVGNHRGNLVSETAHVAVSAGSFVVTNQRLLFIGDRKSFSASHRKILQLQPANDGIHFTETNKQKPRIVIYDHPNGDLVFEVLQRVVTAD